MQIREILATYLTEAIKDPLQEGEKIPLDMGVARAALPTPALEILHSEYRIACAHKNPSINTGTFNFIDVPYVEQIIAQLKTPKAPFKDARTQVTFYPETGTARVTFLNQGYGFGDTIARSADELWKLLRKAATDGIDQPAPKPVPYFTETSEDWLKTHRPTKAAQKKIFTQGSITVAPTKKKKPSMALEEILALNLKL